MPRGCEYEINTEQQWHEFKGLHPVQSLLECSLSDLSFLGSLADEEQHDAFSVSENCFMHGVMHRKRK